MRPSAVTKLRTRLIGACTHDWVMDWFTGASGLHADCFPSLEHPVCGLTRSSLDAIELLPDDAAKAKVLQALGDRENLLKWLASDLVLRTAFLDDEEVAQLDWDDWWQRHAWAFDVCHDKEVARQLVLDNLTDWRGYGTSKTLGMLGLSEENEASAPGGPQEFRVVPGR